MNQKDMRDKFKQARFRHAVIGHTINLETNKNLKVRLARFLRQERMDGPGVILKQHMELRRR